GGEGRRSGQPYRVRVSVEATDWRPRRDEAPAGRRHPVFPSPSTVTLQHELADFRQALPRRTYVLSAALPSHNLHLSLTFSPPRLTRLPSLSHLCRLAARYERPCGPGFGVNDETDIQSGPAQFGDGRAGRL